MASRRAALSGNASLIATSSSSFFLFANYPRSYLTKRHSNKLCDTLASEPDLQMHVQNLKIHPLEIRNPKLPLDSSSTTLSLNREYLQEET